RCATTHVTWSTGRAGPPARGDDYGPLVSTPMWVGAERKLSGPRRSSVAMATRYRRPPHRPRASLDGPLLLGLFGDHQPHRQVDQPTGASHHREDDEQDTDNRGIHIQVLSEARRDTGDLPVLATAVHPSGRFHSRSSARIISSS